MQCGNVPEQIHISFAGSGMRVAWFTWEQSNSTSVQTVLYGTEKNNLIANAAAESSRQYLVDYGYHHVAKLPKLSTDQQYYYKVGSNGIWSDIFSFTTPPGTGDKEWSVSIFGDMGYADSSERPMLITIDGLVKDWSATFSRKTLEALKDKKAIDWIWHLGDIGYIDDAYAHNPVKFVYENTYNTYMNWLQNLTSSIAYMVSVGNHESECHSAYCYLGGTRGKSLSNFSAYNTRWHMPSPESGGQANMWYSWDYGGVHFVSINSETDWNGAEEFDTGDSHDSKLPAGHFGVPGEYLMWLEQDLKTARATIEAGESGLKYIVAGGHRPYGDIKTGKGGEAAHTELFAKYGVDLYVAGHGHSYSRGAPVNGTTYVMVGGAGCDEMEQGENGKAYNAAAVALMQQQRRLRPTTSPLRQGPAAQLGYAVARGTEVMATSRYSTGVLTVNATGLHWRLIDSVNGEILDSFSIQ